MNSFTKFHIHSIKTHEADIDHVLLLDLWGHVPTFYIVMLQITRPNLTASEAKWVIWVASESAAYGVMASEVKEL